MSFAFYVWLLTKVSFRVKKLFSKTLPFNAKAEIINWTPFKIASLATYLKKKLGALLQLFRKPIFRYSSLPLPTIMAQVHSKCITAPSHSGFQSHDLSSTLLAHPLYDEESEFTVIGLTLDQLLVPPITTIKSS